ncbi:MAG: helix-turn-helix domain-containing protein [Defluviitaleaceae bacterium]|nr:helix-turn-helix domain-containing protein [Defluviitaleaceae bacterium]
MNRDIRKKLIEDFFELGGNKNIDRSIALEKRIKKYFSENKSEDRILLNILVLLRISVEERNFNDFKEMCKMAIPIIESLMKISIDKWEFDDVRIAQAVLVWAQSFEESDMLCRKVLSVLNKFIDVKPIYMIKFFIHSNMTSRLLRADYTEIDHEKEADRSKLLNKLFEEHLNHALAICSSRGKELRPYELIILIRKSIFERDNEEVINNLVRLRETEEKELYIIMKDTVKFYSSFSGFNITKKQFDIRTGSNIRHYREQYGMTLYELGEYLDLSHSQVSALERGDRSISAYLLLKIATKFSISTDNIYFGPNKKVIHDDKEKTKIEELAINAVGLGSEGVGDLCDIAKILHRQKRRLEKKPISSIADDF